MHGGVLKYTRSGLHYYVLHLGMYICFPISYTYFLHFVLFLHSYPFIRSCICYPLHIVYPSQSFLLYRLRVSPLSTFLLIALFLILLYYSCVIYNRFVCCNTVIPIVPTEIVLSTIDSFFHVLYLVDYYNLYLFN